MADPTFRASLHASVEKVRRKARPTRTIAASRNHRGAASISMSRPIAPARRVPWDQYKWLGWPPCERPHWVLAPGSMNFHEAEVWARAYADDQGGVAQIVPLSTGDTLVRIRDKPWPHGKHHRQAAE
jgi:hypothetical protein